MTKALVFGWMEELEKWPKVAGRPRKTVLYWRKLLREAGVDILEVGRLASDRRGWKAILRERMEHLAKYEKSKSKRWSGGVVERNKKVVQEDVFICNVCEKVCRSKAGLTNHKRAIHEISNLKKAFKCGSCDKSFGKEASLVNHKKHSVMCGGSPRQARVYKGARGPCPLCGKEMATTNISRHIKESCPQR